MKRFRIITAICLSTIAIMVAGNVWYLYSLYNSIKTQTLQTVNECVRRADILEIINRLNEASQGENDSFIRMTLVVQGEKTTDGGYGYNHLLENISQTMSEYFHLVEQSEQRMAERDFSVLDSIFRNELNSTDIYPDKVMIRPITENAAPCRGLWEMDFSISDNHPPIYKVRFSTLQGHILRQMAGIIATSAAILVLMGLLIWYLLHWVGKLRSIEQMKDDFTHNMTHELKTPVLIQRPTPCFGIMTRATRRVTDSSLK